MNSDLTKVKALVAAPEAPAEDSMAMVPGPDCGYKSYTRKPRVRKPKAAPAVRDVFIDPQPGDAVTANGRTRHVLRIQHGYVYYNLGEIDSRDHAVSLAGWRSWCREWGVR